MTKKKVLLVGHCGVDSPRLEQMLKSHFDVEVERANYMDEVPERIQETHYDLLLINRVGYFDGKSGIELIKQLHDSGKVPPKTKLMLITNYEDAMKEAMENGAVKGFGKKKIDHPDTIALLRQYLE